MASLPLHRSRRQPAYGQGFARTSGMSAFPQLWQGLVSAHVPQLGATGNTLPGLIPPNTRASRNGTPSWTTSQFGQVIRYVDSAGDFWSIDTNNFDQARGSIVCRWRLTDTTSTNRPYGGISGGDQSNLEIFFGTVRVDWGTSTNLAFNFSTVDDEWAHTVWTWDNGAYEGFHNGTSVASGSYTGTSGWGTTFAIGGQIGFGAVFDGDIAELYVYNRVITPSESRILFYDGLAPFRLKSRIFVTPEVAGAGRIMGALAGRGGLAGAGGLAGSGGGLAG